MIRIIPGYIIDMERCERYLQCDSYPFCAGCNAYPGTKEDLQELLDKCFENKPYKVLLR